ncbi:MAG: cytidine deaminase [Pyrinomonadaceae bacterium MAG19_C2-C3]|nr:cytidine deaminase [Pyrinomonadaceae bacterium MAG19_C2-C3]
MKEINQHQLEALIDSAKLAREFAVAPFSNFKVGAAILTEGGGVFTGCNIENASYGLTVCAERVALWKALSEGGYGFMHLVVVADTNDLTPPCGACRQIIWEFAGDISVTMTNLAGESETIRMSELFPRAFDVKFLDDKGSGR